jgi:hypothetical protein
MKIDPPPPMAHSLLASLERIRAEEVLVNPWFGLAGLVGSAIITGSFFAQWKIRRSG